MYPDHPAPGYISHDFSTCSLVKTVIDDDSKRFISAFCWPPFWILHCDDDDDDDDDDDGDDDGDGDDDDDEEEEPFWNCFDLEGTPKSGVPF